MTVLVLVAHLWAAVLPAAAAEPAPGLWWAKELRLPSLAKIDDRLREPLADLPKVVLKRKSPRPIQSCADLIAISRQKFRLAPDTEVASRAFASQQSQCLALEALKTAKPASRSYVAGFRLSPASVAKLPPGFALYFSDDEEQDVAEAAKQCKPLGDYDGSLSVKMKGDEADVTTDGWSGRIVLYARGDLNGDGIEDLMLLRQGQASGGTATESTVFIVTRTSPSGCLQTIATLPAPAAGQ